VRRRRLPVAGPPDLSDRLGSLVRSTPWLLEALAAARDVDPLTSAADGVATWPETATADHYRRRVRDKRIADRWPRVEILGC
jgi:hypothetical protein